MIIIKPPLMVLFLFSFLFQLCSSQSNYITWEDMRIQSYQTGKMMDYYDSSGDNNGTTTTSSRVIVVTKDGTGDSVTVQGAIDLVPHQNTRRIKIFILPGFYSERVMVPKTKPYISFIGNNTSETIILWHTKASDRTSNGEEIGTFNTATVDVESTSFFMQRTVGDY